MKRLIFFLSIFSFYFLFSDSLNFLPAEGAMTMNNREYSKNLLKLIKNSKKTIHIMMLEGGYYPERKEGVNQKIYESLFDAVKRGVDVKIILDQSGFNPNQSIRNKDLGDFLRSGGIKVYYDDPEATLHAKALIIDSVFVIVGSTNWSYQALDKNNEASILIKSDTLAHIYENYFSKILEKAADKITVF
ncbi:MAG: phospholipase D-like domain-containing protein [candidate division WOR-3 bacterium]